MPNSVLVTRECTPGVYYIGFSKLVMMKRTSYLIICAILVMCCNSCLRPKDYPEVPPSYTIEFYSYSQNYGYSTRQDVSSGTITIRVPHTIDADKHETLSFRLKSGSPENYPIECYFSDVPAGIECNFDTLRFRLNYSQKLEVKATSCPSGTYLVNLNMYNDRLGLKSYPILFLVN
jgi:hypothetical protein